MKNLKTVLIVFSFILKIQAQISIPDTSYWKCEERFPFFSYNFTSGKAPFTFNIITPCDPSPYILKDADSLQKALQHLVILPLCAGLHTITVVDSLGVNWGTFTHLVIQETFYDILYLGHTLDGLVCLSTVPSQLLFPDSYRNAWIDFTIHPFVWNTGETTSTITISPAVTTSYSVTGTLSSSASRTCLAEGKITVQVFGCLEGMDTNTVEKNEVALHLYPNPAKDYLFIKSDEIIIDISIFNSLGQIYHEQNIHSTERDINISTLRKGIYYIRVLTVVEQKGFKILKE